MSIPIPETNETNEIGSYVRFHKKFHMMFMLGNAELTSWKTGSDFTPKDFRGHAVQRSYSTLATSALSSAQTKYGENKQIEVSKVYEINQEASV